MFLRICRPILLCCLTLVSFVLSAQMKYATTLPEVDASAVGVYIEDLVQGSVVLDINGEVPIVPASVTKLLTAASVVNTYGVGYRFSTDVVARGVISDGSLRGDVVVIASGDPTLDSAHFPEYMGVADSIAVALQRMGINRIEGSVVIDKSQYLEQPIPDGWTDEDVVFAYGTGAHAINYADNRFTLTMPDAELSPITPSVKIKHNYRRKGASVRRARGSKILNVYSSQKRRFSSTLANPDPESAFLCAIDSALHRCDIKLVEKRFRLSDTTELIYSHKSPPVGDILKSLMLRSDNLMAESMLRLLAPGQKREVALAREVDMWWQNGVDTCLFKVEDGSGLSRNNRIAPYVLADVLVWMLDNSPNFNEYLAMFPKAGVSGTLRNFLNDTPLEGRFMAKTGSLNHVQCYAGYKVNDVGVPTHVVIIMINGFKGSRSGLKSKLEQLLIEKLL